MDNLQSLIEEYIKENYDYVVGDKLIDLNKEGNKQVDKVIYYMLAGLAQQLADDYLKDKPNFKHRH